MTTMGYYFRTKLENKFLFNVEHTNNKYKINNYYQATKQYR